MSEERILKDEEIKEEMLNKATVSAKEAEGYLKGFFHVCGEISKTNKGLSCFFTFRNTYSAMLFCQCVQTLFDYHPELDIVKPSDGRKNQRIECAIPQFVGVRILEEVGILKQKRDGEYIFAPVGNKVSDGIRKAFLTAVAIDCGRFTYYGDYKLELVLPDEDSCRFIKDMIEGYELKSSETDDGRLVFRNEALYRFLALCGANSAALTLSSYCVEKEERANINRTSNFQTANTDKSLTASAYQYWAIVTLREKGKLGLLPSVCIRLAEVRERNKEASLGDLAAMLGISKSTAFHRMKKITDLAEEYR